jgi:uncharacterized protein (DUF1697 family)
VAAMTVMVVLLRGVNVGGHSKVPMADLRKWAEAAGFENVKTYIQSGNLVCTTPEKDSAAVAESFRKILVAETELKSPAVMARTRDELAAVIDANPFAQRGEDEAHMHVSFMAPDVDLSKALDGLDLDSYAPEEVVAVGHEVYLFLPNGMGRSKLATDLAKNKSKRPQGTARNWRTTTKLLAMADELS